MRESANLYGAPGEKKNAGEAATEAEGSCFVPGSGGRGRGRDISVSFCEFETNLVYNGNSRTVKTVMPRNLVLKKPTMMCGLFKGAGSKTGSFQDMRSFPEF